MFSKGGVHEKSLVTLKTHRFRSFRHYFSKIGLVKVVSLKILFFWFRYRSFRHFVSAISLVLSRFS